MHVDDESPTEKVPYATSIKLVHHYNVDMDPYDAPPPGVRAVCGAEYEPLDQGVWLVTMMPCGECVSWCIEHTREAD